MIRVLVIICASVAAMLVSAALIQDHFPGTGDKWGNVLEVIFLIVMPVILFKWWRVKPDPAVIPIDYDDPLIKAQIIRSRNEVGRFLTGLKQRRVQAFVKFPFNPDGAVEHVWGLVHEYKEKRLIVSIVSDLIGEWGEQIPEKIPIAIEELEDWLLELSDGTSHGGYSLLAMAKIYERDHGKLPLKYSEHLKSFRDFHWRSKR